MKSHRYHGRGIFALPARLLHNAEGTTAGGSVADTPAAATTPAVPAVPASSANAAPAVAAPAVAAATAAAPAPAAAPATPADPSAEPAWLKARLERERKTALKTVGFESEEDAKAAAAERRAAADAKKTLEQRAIEAEQRLKTEAERAKSLEDSVRLYADGMLSKLTPEQLTAVRAIAGEDPSAQMRAITALTPTWSKAQQAAAAVAANAPAATPQATPAATTPAAAPVAQPANTAPGKTAPADASTSPLNHKQQYEQLRATNPFEAAQYGLAHATEVYLPKS